MRLNRDDIEKINDLGKDAVVDLIMQLVERIEVLERQLAKDSHKNIKPPSSYGLQKKQRTRISRKRSGKRLADRTVILRVLWR
jgi:transposase